MKIGTHDDSQADEALEAAIDRVIGVTRGLPLAMERPWLTLAPGALATGHGLGGGATRAGGGSAYEEFVRAVRHHAGGQVWSRVLVIDQSAWVQIRGAAGRVYVAKTRQVVSRVESTLRPEMVPAFPPPPPGSVNATRPDRPNGRIQSWVRADERLVAGVVTLISKAH